jgi:hypothetical protein
MVHTAFNARRPKYKQHNFFSLLNIRINPQHLNEKLSTGVNNSNVLYFYTYFLLLLLQSKKEEELFSTSIPVIIELNGSR